ncbi:Hypothetical Protein FCC1311_048282 [Hondaea fermentalgiana]|uniref:Uncharacterized protein n=1 Tax=Hondaea fermentalgiana TaxID=2315210 RepID=A0A2R5GC98_9STRA|nr:Hypothetical Protein FCC1311_048282 [Hondaea fermentalgiana]|eukprot:GBG28607.1 Hypothetical Protein FCC1311_048282 [Hondaea fermentalgiana]
MDERGGICAAFLHLLRTEDTSLEAELARIDDTLNALHDDAAQNRETMLVLRRSLVALKDESLPFSTRSMDRATAKKTLSQRLVGHIKLARSMERQISFFERTRMSLVSSQLAEEMATNIAALRARTAGLRHVDLDRLHADMEEIEDVNADARAANDAVADTMRLSARNDDALDDEQLLAEFLAEEEKEEAPLRVDPPRELQRAAPRAVDSPRRERVPLLE